MTLDPRSCYQALRSKDYRYDGRFFVGVKTTGIYCRPVCPAKAALFKNVVFYRTAAEAAEHGFRPCKRCRPESAAGSPLWNGTSTTVSRALKLIDEGYLIKHDVSALAHRLGLGERHLRSLFIQHVGVAPKSLANTKRLDFARSLIDTTDLSMSDIAMTAGFASIRRFNDAIKNRYHTTPSALRKSTDPEEQPQRSSNCYVTYLAYRPPYDWGWLLPYLEHRSLPGIEIVSTSGAGSYVRSFRIGRSSGWFRVTPEAERHRVRVEIFLSKAVSLMQITQRIRGLFDLNADPMLISNALSSDPHMKALVERFPGTRLPGSWDGFETAVKTIVGQLISIKAAASISGRIVEAHGKTLRSDESGAPTRLFPEPGALAEADLTPTGLTRTKARAIRELARMVRDRKLVFEGIVDYSKLRDQLLEIPGLGPWSADYITLKLSDPDAFPGSDLVIARCLDKIEPKNKSVPDRWKPWRGYATHYLWRSYGQDG